MRLFRARITNEEFNLGTAAEEELVAERNRLRELRRSARKQMLAIQQEIDRRAQENPPERGQVVKVGR